VLALASDFNGDGLIDLFVGNSHYGIPFQTKELGLPVFPAKENIGRAEKRSLFINRVPSFLWNDIEDGRNVMITRGTEKEAEGRNSLFLNRGDKDGDGLPEWEDVTEQVGIGGREATFGATVADIDRDGDLDVYIANFLDPDFWGFGADKFAGNRNELYINQLTETGELSFKQVAEEYRVAGLHKEENLPSSQYWPRKQDFVKIADQTHKGQQVGEEADHSWSAKFVDWNDDGWPDLIVANDLGNRLRIYENQEGKSFKRLTQFDDPYWDGCWMGIDSGDLDGDMKDEILVTNCGSQTFAARNNAIFADDGIARGVNGLAVVNALKGISSPMTHTLLSYTGEEEGLKPLETMVEIQHSETIPPDVTKRENVGKSALPIFEKYNFSKGLTGIEFAWSPVFFDLDNDGDLDIYMAGALARGNDGFIGDWSGSPGRLLVNESQKGAFSFKDLTLEYQVLDISGIDYGVNPPRRKSPGTNWHKRDKIYITDTDSYSETGLEASKGSAVLDIFRMHEAANGIICSDLNNDGSMDMVVTHCGGYNSNLESARNLKVNFMGKALAVPAPNKLNKPPSNFEEGPTYVYINGGPPKGSDPNWVKIQLKDDKSFNRFGLGAKLIINGKIMRRVTLGGQAFSSTMSDLHVGLGAESLKEISISWPSGGTELQIIQFDPPVKNKTVSIHRD